MSIEYRIAVPKGRRGVFEKAIQRVKEAKILKVKVRSSEAALVNRYVRQHREILDKFQQPKPIEIQAGIYRGYQALFRDVIEGNQASTELTDERFKSVVNYLLEETKESKPKRVDTVHGHISWFGTLLDPRQAQALIYKYGLLDGEIRSGADTLRMMGYSSKSRGSAGHMLSWSLVRVERYLKEQRLLIPKS